MNLPHLLHLFEALLLVVDGPCEFGYLLRTLSQVLIVLVILWCLVHQILIQKKKKGRDFNQQIESG